LDPTIVLNFFFTAYPNAENMTTRTWVSPANNSRDMQDYHGKTCMVLFFLTKFATATNITQYLEQK